MNSQHPPDGPGYSHGYGFNIVWGESGDGTRPEEVLRAVLERVQFLQNQLPCEENLQIIRLLNEAMDWEEQRNQRRAEQGVQGTLNPHVSSDDPTEDMGVFVGEAQEAHPEPNPELEVTEHPHPLDIAMPTQDSRFIPQAVLEGIAKQGIPYRLWVSTKYSDGQVAAARNHTRKLALQGTAPYILMTDNDLIFGEGDFEAMITWMEEHPDFGAIAISKHGDPDPSNPNSVVESDHVDAGPVLFRRTVYEQFEYSNEGGTCECAAMCKNLRENMNQRIGFLTGRTVKHIQNTRLSQ